MDDMNYVGVMGRLVRDAENKDTRGGRACRMVLAVNRTERRQDKDPVERTSYIEAMYWNPSEKLVPHLTQGRQVGIEGELRQESWERDGQRSSRTWVLVRKLHLIGQPKQKQASDENPEQPVSKPAQDKGKDKDREQKYRYRGMDANDFDEGMPF